MPFVSDVLRKPVEASGLIETSHMHGLAVLFATQFKNTRCSGF